MLTRLVLAIGMLLLATGFASAASFDCKKASTPLETIICTSSDLGTLDEKLAVAYATALGGLREEATAVMRQGQRDWLDFIQLYCSETGEGPLVVGEKAASCLQSEYTARLRVLEGSRMLNSWRVYLAQHYNAIPDTNPDGNEFSKVAAKVVVTPRIDSDIQIAKEINAFVDGYAELGDDGDMLNDNSLIATFDDIRPYRATLRVSESYYPHGAAHGGYQTSFAHYLIFEGRALEASDIFAGDAWQDELAVMVEDELRRKLGELMWQDIKTEMLEWVVDPSRWSFTDDNLVVHMRPYEVASFADGEPRAEIPWSRLQEFLAGGANEIVFW